MNEVYNMTLPLFFVLLERCLALFKVESFESIIWPNHTFKDIRSLAKFLQVSQEIVVLSGRDHLRILN